MTLGEKLQTLRKENGLSQEQVAEQVGVSRQAVSKWETNLSNPDTENLIRLAKLFKVSMDEMTGSGPGNEEKPVGERQASIHHRVFQPIAAYTGFMIVSHIKTNEPGFYSFMLVLILISGVFMAWNLWREPDRQLRARNAMIELGYCLVIYAVMTWGTMAIGNLFSGIIAIACGVIYLKEINPKYMARTIFR